MYHHVAHSMPGTLLFSNWDEGHALWGKLIEPSSGLVAACLMPNHFHVLAHHEQRARLGRVMQGFANWRNRGRGEGGSVWHRSPPVEHIVDPKHQRATERYIHRNPRKDGLVLDPATWPFTTHRDALGLTWSPLRRPVDDPAWYHRHVLKDERSTQADFRLPQAIGPAAAARFPLAAVVEATCAWTASPPSTLSRPGPPRRLFLRAARALADAKVAEIAAVASVSQAGVFRHRPLDPGECQRFALLIADPRFRLFDRPPPGLDWKFKV